MPSSSWAPRYFWTEFLPIHRPLPPFKRLTADVGWYLYVRLNHTLASCCMRAGGSQRAGLIAGVARICGEPLRIAEKIGPLSYEILSPAPSQLAPILQEALEVEAANWKGSEGSAMARDSLRGPFYRHYAAAASAAGILRVCFLRVGSKAVAMQLALESARGFWLLKIGHREEYARCSPGMLLLAETIRYAASRGLASYEFLGNAHDWTRIWTPDEVQTVTIRAYPFRVRSVVALAVDAFQSALRRFQAAANGKME